MASAVKQEAQALFGRATENLARGKKLDAARDLYEAVKLQPDFFDAIYNLALVLQELDQCPEAIACYEQALRINPDFPQAWNNVGVAHHKAGRSARAVDCHRRAIALQPGVSSNYNNLANALRGLSQPGEAIREIEAGLRIEPSSAILRLNLGDALREAGRIQESVAAYDELLRMEPSLAEAHFGRGFSLLLAGDMAAGWDEYEWRWRLKDHPPPRELPQPSWQGEPLDGARILVHAEQGAGDCIQFARFIPELVLRGATVILECPGPLVRLCRTIQGVREVIPKGSPLPAFDRSCALMSVPRFLKTTLDSVPAPVPYLRAPEKGPELPRDARAKSSDLKVGLVWAGAPGHRNDRHRSIPLELLEPLLTHAGTVFYNLQLRPDLGGASHPLEAQMINLASLIKDYSDTAALVAQLDLVISVDTSVAHVAGALGRPVWLLLPFAPDWRWLLGREDSPWYPIMRLFRQPQPGDWTAVVKHVETELDARVRVSGQAG
jgi:Tfp pilus assembly protein PilF